MRRNTKYIYLLLKERNGEYEYSHPSVHELSDTKKITAEKFTKKYLREFYAGSSKHADEGYYFYDGEVFVKLYTWNFVSAEEYNILREYL